MPIEDAMRHLNAARHATKNPKVRTTIGNIAKKMHEQRDFSIYTHENIQKEVREKFFPVYKAERVTQELLSLLEKGNGYRVDELPAILNSTHEELEKIIQTLTKKGTIKQEDQKLILIKSAE